MTSVRWVLGTACLLVISACSQRSASDLNATLAAPIKTQLAQETASPTKARTLAYEHTVRIELSEEQLPERMREVQTACTTNANFGCTLLDFSLSTSEVGPTGTIRMRLAPAGVNPILAIASQGGNVASRTTHAEDLAEPVADTERELALLSTHRDRLAEFMKDRRIKVDELITVSKELAAVQSQIDMLSTHRANLRRRIDTELLTINMGLARQDYAAQRTPVRDAVRSFGTDMKEAFADVIRFTAAVLPWLLIIVPGLILMRLFWRWIGRWLGRREDAGATRAGE